MIGRKAYHISFGCGTITELSCSNLAVDFNGNLRKFSYPDAFEALLASSDSELIERIRNDIQTKQSAHKAVVPNALRLSSALPHKVKRKKSMDHLNVAFKCNFCVGADCFLFYGLKTA